MKNSVYNLSGGCLRIAIKLLTIPLLIRAMGLENYGTWMLVTSVIESMLIVEAGFAVSTTVFLARELSQGRTKDVQETLTIVVVGIVILALAAVLIMVFAVPEGALIFGKLTQEQREAVLASLRWSTVVIVARMLQQVFVGVQQAHLKYARINVLNTLQTLVLSIGLVWLAQRDSTLTDLMIWYACASIIVLALHGASALSLLRGIPLRPRMSIEKTVALAKYSGGSWGSSLGSVVFSHFDKVLVGALLGPASLGIYGFFTSVCAQINAISAMAVQPLLPALSLMLGKEKMFTANMLAEVKKAVGLNCLIALSSGAGLIASAPWLMRWLIPAAADESSVCLFRLTAVIYGVYSLNAVGYYLLYALHRVGSCMGIQLISGIASLLAIYVGAVQFGLPGALMGNGAYWLVWGLTFMAMRKLGVPVRIWCSWFVSPLAAFSLLLVLSFLLPDTSLFIVVKITAVVAMYSLLTLRLIRYNITSKHA